MEVDNMEKEISWKKKGNVEEGGEMDKLERKGIKRKVKWDEWIRDFKKFGKGKWYGNKELMEMVLEYSKGKKKVYYSELYRVLDKGLKEGWVESRVRGRKREWRVK